MRGEYFGDPTIEAVARAICRDRYPTIDPDFHTGWQKFWELHEFTHPAIAAIKTLKELGWGPIDAKS